MNQVKDLTIHPLNHVINCTSYFENDETASVYIRIGHETPATGGTLSKEDCRRIGEWFLKLSKALK